MKCSSVPPEVSEAVRKQMKEKETSKTVRKQVDAEVRYRMTGKSAVDDEEGEADDYYPEDLDEYAADEREEAAQMRRAMRLSRQQQDLPIGGPGGSSAYPPPQHVPDGTTQTKKIDGHGGEE